MSSHQRISTTAQRREVLATKHDESKSLGRATRAYRGSYIQHSSRQITHTLLSRWQPRKRTRTQDTCHIQPEALTQTGRADRTTGRTDDGTAGRCHAWRCRGSRTAPVVASGSGMSKDPFLASPSVVSPSHRAVSAQHTYAHTGALHGSEKKGPRGVCLRPPRGRREGEALRLRSTSWMPIEARQTGFRVAQNVDKQPSLSSLWCRPRVSH